MNIGMIIGRVKAESESASEEKGPSKAELLAKAKEAAASRIIKAVKEEEPGMLMFALRDYEELCSVEPDQE